MHIPRDYPVQPLRPGQVAEDKATCGACGRSWDDGKIPTARCPFEAFHAEEGARWTLDYCEGCKVWLCGDCLERHAQIEQKAKPKAKKS